MRSPRDRSKPRTMGSSPWWYTSELQSVKKLVEQHSRDMRKTECTLCGLQRRITEATHNLANRVEALEAGKVPSEERPMRTMLGGCDDASGRRLDLLAVSVTDLEARFELFRSETDAQIASSMASIEELRGKQDDEAALLTTDDLQACLKNASSHVTRLERLSEKWKAQQVPQGNGEQLEQDGGDNVFPSAQDGKEPRRPQRQHSFGGASYDCRFGGATSSTFVGPNRADSSDGLSTFPSGSDVGAGSAGDLVAYQPGVVSTSVRQFAGGILEMPTSRRYVAGSVQKGEQATVLTPATSARSGSVAPVIGRTATVLRLTNEHVVSQLSLPTLPQAWAASATTESHKWATGGQAEDPSFAEKRKASYKAGGVFAHSQQPAPRRAVSAPRHDRNLGAYPPGSPDSTSNAGGSSDTMPEVTASAGSSSESCLSSLDSECRRTTKMQDQMPVASLPVASASHTISSPRLKEQYRPCVTQSQPVIVPLAVLTAQSSLPTLRYQTLSSGSMRVHASPRGADSGRKSSPRVASLHSESAYGFSSITPLILA